MTYAEVQSRMSVTEFQVYEGHKRMAKIAFAEGRSKLASRYMRTVRRIARDAQII